MFEEHIDCRADVTIACKTATLEEATGLGIVQIDPDRTITAFHEKPSAEQLPALAVDVGALRSCSKAAINPEAPYLASMGVYLFNREVLLDLLSSTPGEDFGRQIIPAAIRTRRVCASIFPGYWEDVGTIRAFYQANLNLLGENPPYRFHDLNAPVFTRLRPLPGIEVRNSTLDRVIIGEGSTISGSRIQNSIIGIRASVQPDCHLEDVILMGADYYDGESRATPCPANVPPLGLGRGVRARRAIIDKNARVGDGCIILNEKGITHLDAPTHTIRDGIVIIPKGTVLPPGTVI
jgi:glucose-1-phosphate adenylyltransferase